MEISMGTLAKLVKAARTADRMAEDVRALLIDNGSRTVPDEIAGFLKDVLFEISGEKLDPKQDFERDSMTMALVRSKLADRDVADEINRMSEYRKFEVCTWGLPIENMVLKNGGYCPATGYVPPREVEETPEGEWR